MSAERLQKLLARAGVASRRGVEDLIRAGRVTVNGTVAELGMKAEAGKDHVKVDGKRIPLEAPTEPIYLLLHKPDGVMSTVHDPGGRPTVMDLIPQRLRKALVPVGRLDFHSTGLLLLTNDGDFAHRVGHPRYGCSKRYEVKVKGVPTSEQLEKLRKGIFLDGRRTAPATVERRSMPRGKHSQDHTWWKVELVEGRNRQIREMFQRIGHPVQRLRRVAIGPVTDPRLPVGQYRELTPAEVEALSRTTAARGRKPVASKSTTKRGAGPRAESTRKPKAKGKPGPGQRGGRSS